MTKLAGPHVPDTVNARVEIAALMELSFRWGHRQLTITTLIKEMTQTEGKVMHDMENKQNEGKLEGESVAIQMVR